MFTCNFNKVIYYVKFVITFFSDNEEFEKENEENADE